MFLNLVIEKSASIRQNHQIIPHVKKADQDHVNVEFVCISWLVITSTYLFIISFSFQFQMPANENLVSQLKLIFKESVFLS
jgi:hypothetical protein